MFRKSGAYYYAIARGKDDRPVRPDRERKSYGGENTFETDTTDRAVLLDEITAIADKLWEHRERIGKDGRTVTLKIKFADFEQITRSKTPGNAVDNRMMPPGIYEELLDSIMPLERPLRLLGLTLSNLIDPPKQPTVAQPTLALYTLKHLTYS